MQYQPRSQGLRGETVTKTLVKFVLSFQNFAKKIACAVRHNRIAITVEYGCVSLRMRFFSQNFGTIKRIYQGLRHRLTAKALGPRLMQYKNFFYHSQKRPDLLQVVNFTGLLQPVNNLQQTCQFHQVATSRLRSDLLQHVNCRLVTATWNNL